MGLIYEEATEEERATYANRKTIPWVKEKQTESADNKEAWPNPEPLPKHELPTVAMLQQEIIPEPFQAWLLDISHRMQCPIEFVAVGAVVCISSIIGAGCAIRPKRRDDWEVVPNLWGGPVARPSMLKTPALAEVMKPIVRLEMAEKESFDERQQYYEAVCEEFKVKRDALKQEMAKAAIGKSNRTMDVIRADYASLKPDKEAIRRRFKTNDSTVEKLGELLNNNARGILVFRDELTGLLSTLDRDDHQSDRAFFLEAWNGLQGFTTDRIGRGTIDIGNVCLSILGGIQPSKLTDYLLRSVGNLTNDGMVQRFQLLVYPDEPAVWKLIDETPNTSARNRAHEIFKTLADMDFIQAGACQDEEGRPYFRFNDEAQELFYEWITELEGKIKNEENPLLCEHFAKYRSLMPSLALIFHLIDVAGGAATGPVSATAAAMAAEWVDFLEANARRIYGLIQDMGPKSAAVLAKKIEQGKVRDGFTLRDVYNNDWNLLTSAELVANACDELESLGWLRKEVITETGGRPGIRYKIHPQKIT